MAEEALTRVGQDDLRSAVDGEFSGLALLAYMHVGFRMFDPSGDAGTGLDREYEAAVQMRRKR